MLKQSSLEELKKESAFLCIGLWPTMVKQIDLSVIHPELVHNKQVMLVVIPMDNVEKSKIIDVRAT